ncbi:MAG TPA: glycosyltransferase family 87 protein [Chloroflexota bacterium]|nr:glycosyltransferase family 87 protein [Chloroflexota bacterium]
MSRRALIVLLVLEVALWGALIGAGGLFRDGPNGRTLSVDYAVFLSGARLLQTGGNPYSTTALYNTEYRMLHRQGIAATPHKSLVLLGNPPILYWALQPLTGYPYRVTASLWVAAMAVFTLVGFLCAVAGAGCRRVLLPAATYVLMPQTALVIAYGNITALVFAALGAGYLLAPTVPSLAGVILVLCWLKPQVGLPFVLLILLFRSRRRLPLVAGFGIGTLAFAIANLVLGLTVLHEWVSGLTAFSASLASQPNLASLSGLYGPVASGPARLVIEVAVVLVAMCLGAYALKHRHRTIAWLWIAWFLAVPYAHFPDEIVFSIPLLPVLRRPAGSTLAIVYALFLSVALFPTIHGVSLLPIPLLAIAAVLYMKRNSPGAREPGDMGRMSPKTTPVPEAGQ